MLNIKPLYKDYADMAAYQDDLAEYEEWCEYIASMKEDDAYESARDDKEYFKMLEKGEH